MISAPIHHEFGPWRTLARSLLMANVPPEQVMWTDEQLLPDFAQPAAPVDDRNRRGVPPAFLRLAQRVVHHRSADTSALLYRILWRLTHGEHGLLSIVVDDDIRLLNEMDRKVGHDVHRMHAFLRFRRVEGEQGGEEYVAWHQPDHLIMPLALPFFVRRFATMHWTILTPDSSAHWDGLVLRSGPGVPRSAAPQADELEELWRTYYGATFNPARVSLKTMRQHMPTRYWATMPETEIIHDLLRDAPRRVEEMVKRQSATTSTPGGCPTASSAAEFVPQTHELKVLREASKTCRGCGIYCNATQTVFGEGPDSASLMFVGEQPGDQEDLAGHPFVGPSGALLNEVLEEVGIPRDQTYVTNAVKHFKFEPRGKRRIHSKPSAREVAACRPWLQAEIAALKPKMIVTLGATAAQSLLGNGFRVTHHRGEVLEGHEWAKWMLATVHPSSLLRLPDPAARAEGIKQFADDLRVVAKQFKQG